MQDGAEETFRIMTLTGGQRKKGDLRKISATANKSKKSSISSGKYKTEVKY